MALRIIELFIPKSEDLSYIREKINEYNVHGIWQEDISSNYNLFKILVDTGHSGPVLDLLEKSYSNVKGFRVILLPVEATVPRIVTDEKVKKDTSADTPSGFKIGRGISREELYADVSSGARVTGFFLFLVFLSTLVATIGIMKNNVAVIIGAMVIAPLIGPNVALALSTTLGDGQLLKNSIKANLSGLLVSLLPAVIAGMVFNIDIDTPELLSRTRVDAGDIVLALASGSAGALSFTMGLPSAIIGVMVAVALLPPTVTLGLLLGAGFNTLAAGSLMLLMINIICINLSGVTTFLFQGVRPLTWWESTKARRATKIAIVFWTTLLIVLFILIYITG